MAKDIYFLESMCLFVVVGLDDIRSDILKVISRFDSWLVAKYILIWQFDSIIGMPS